MSINRLDPRLLEGAKELRFAPPNASNPQDRPNTLDDRFLELSKALPGFGGLFYDNSGTLNIYLLDPRQKVRAKSALQSVFGEQLLQRANTSRNNSGTKIYSLDQVEIATLQGQFSFSDLKTWTDRISNSIASMQGVVFIDADEKHNRVTIAVEPGSRVDLIEKTLLGQRIPLEAVRFIESHPFVHLYTLHDALRPTFGGQRITWYDAMPGVILTCSLGFNAFHYLSGAGFLTASHCSKFPAYLDYGAYYQPVPNLFVGYEAVDPTYFTGGICPPGRDCRYADANFVRYDPSWSAYAIIGHTYYRSVVLQDSPFFYVVGEISYPMVGDPVEKVGQTTGWTSANVSNTCVNVYISDSDFTYLCQDVVHGAGVQARPGDSGAPVFRLNGGLNVSLHGILSAGDLMGTYTFSSMDLIKYELGPLATH